MISSASPKFSRLRRGFTLIELMVVVGIMGLFLAAGIPSLYRLWHKQGFQKTVNDVMEVCNNARARAILKSTTTEIIFHPKEGRCELAGTPQADGAQSQSAEATESAKSLSSLGSGTVSAQFGNGTTVELLFVNQFEYTDADAVGVRFFANGTCDEMTLVLRSDENPSKKTEWRKFSLEITTGLVSVESDPNKFLNP